MIYVDRIEDGMAVLETGENTFERVSTALLPPGTKEGSALELLDGAYVPAQDEEAARRKRLLALQNKLFGKDEKK